MKLIIYDPQIQELEQLLEDALWEGNNRLTNTTSFDYQRRLWSIIDPSKEACVTVSMHFQRPDTPNLTTSEQGT
jgi:hypothetical protein